MKERNTEQVRIEGTLALGGCRVMGDRSEEVGERGQMFPVLRRIVGLCNEKTGTFGLALPSS